MHLISCHDGRLINVEDVSLGASAGQGFFTGLPALDDLLPTGGLARGAVHEILWNDQHHHPRPAAFTALLARTGAHIEDESLRPIVWADPAHELYPPALVAMGIPLHHLFLLRAKEPCDQEWALAECLTCKGIGATVAQIGRLNRVAARRLQLAAEKGQSVGLFLRPLSTATGPGSEHAATTRWLIAPAPGQRTVQRWKITLIHGHGGLINQPVYLEFSREQHTFTTHPNPASDRLHTPDRLAHRPPPPKIVSW